MQWCRFQTGQQASYRITEGHRVAEAAGSPYAIVCGGA
jgi:hypothetical protein